MKKAKLVNYYLEHGEVVQAVKEYMLKNLPDSEALHVQNNFCDLNFFEGKYFFTVDGEVPDETVEVKNWEEKIKEHLDEVRSISKKGLEAVNSIAHDKLPPDVSEKLTGIQNKFDALILRGLHASKDMLANKRFL